MIPDNDGGVPIVRVISEHHEDEQRQRMYYDDDKYTSSSVKRERLNDSPRFKMNHNRNNNKYSDRDYNNDLLEADTAPHLQHHDRRVAHDHHHENGRREGEFFATYDSSPIPGEEVVLVEASQPILPPATIDSMSLKYTGIISQEDCTTLGEVAEKVMEIDVNDPYDLCSLLAGEKPAYSAVDEDGYYSSSRRGRRKVSRDKKDDEEDVSLRRNKKSFVSTMLPFKNNKRDFIGGRSSSSKMSVSKYLYKCSTCDSWFGDSVQLKVHMSTHKEKSFKSVKDFIHEKIFKKTEHENHPPSEKVVVCVPLKIEPPLHPPISHHPPVVVMTEHLPTTAETRRMEIVHTPSPPPKAPSTGVPVSQHYAQHRPPIEKMQFNTCEFCGMQFCTYPDLAIHMGEVHNKVSPSEDGNSAAIHKGRAAGQPNNPYKCPQCPASFGTSFNLKRHVRIHTGTRPYKCSDCHAAFITKAQLTTHMRTHTGEKPYKCHICGGKFIQQNNLKRHIMTHTGEKPFKCDKCTAAFISSSDLKRHIRVHTGEKPYKCLHCNKGFTTSGNLSSHYKMHTGEKPYKCHLCTASFSHQSNLKTHVKRHVLPFKCRCGEGWASQDELDGHMETCSGRWCVSTSIKNEA